MRGNLIRGVHNIVDVRKFSRERTLDVVFVQRISTRLCYQRNNVADDTFSAVRS
jgi:hypothetical protein